MLSGWGRYPVLECRLERLRGGEDLRERWGRPTTLIARGNGRSYGDAALNPDLTLSMLALDRMLAFDAATGLLTCEAGVLLADILATFVPRGWFPPVVPGTKFVTVGGMIAADVHGKNHHRDRTFGAHVESLTLATADGRVRECSRSNDAHLFRATLGGMGLTGVILQASFRLQPIETSFVLAETLAARDLDEAMALFETSRDWPYSVAWIDCLARGSALGRALLMRGRFLKRAALPPALAAAPLALPRARRLTLPVDAPSMLLNRVSIGLANRLYYLRGRARRAPRPPAALRSVLLSAGWHRALEPPVRPPGVRPVPVRAAARRERGRHDGAARTHRRGGTGVVSRSAQAVRGRRGGADVLSDAGLYPGARSADAQEHAGAARRAGRDHACARRPDLSRQGCVLHAGPGARGLSRTRRFRCAARDRAGRTGPARIRALPAACPVTLEAVSGPAQARENRTVADRFHTVLVIGATADIGRAIARGFAAQGHAMQLAARDGRRLEHEAQDIRVRTGVAVACHRCDVLGDDGGAALLDALDPLPDVAVCVVGLLDERAERDGGHAAARVMRTNYLGPALLMGALAKLFEKRGSGVLVGISSVAGDRGRASNCVYGSAKAGFSAFLSGLRNRLAASGVHVVTVKPGYVRTRMTDGMDLPVPLTATPDEVADAVVRAVRQRRDVVYVRPIWRWIMLVVRAIPERIFKRLEL